MSTPRSDIAQRSRSAEIDLRARLRGEWSVARTINRGAGAFDGVARFDDDGRGGLRWRERGHLTLGGYAGEARRTYLIAPGGQAGAWEVAFEDGRPFHVLDLRAGRCEVEHRCAADVYRGVYELHGRDRLVVRWRITGPRHDDTIVSEYRRRYPEDSLSRRCSDQRSSTRPKRQ